MNEIEIIKNPSKHNYVYKHNCVINMVSVTLAVSKEIKEKMKKYDEVNWSSFIRKSIDDKVKKLDAIEQLLKKETEINDWSVNLQKKSRKGRAEQLRKDGLIS